MNGQITDSWVEIAPADASVREQLVAAAGQHFSKYGYEKTTLAELAKAVGFSKTYFYRFFASKQEIGEAVCSRCLGLVLTAVHAEVSAASTPTEKLRRMLQVLPEKGAELFFEERKLYDVAAVSAAEQWSSGIAYADQLAATLRDILIQGRESGDFERKTPLDEVTRAILLAMNPFIDPRLLEIHLNLVPDGANEVVRLVLRSLAP